MITIIAACHIHVALLCRWILVPIRISEQLLQQTQSSLDHLSFEMDDFEHRNLFPWEFENRIESHCNEYAVNSKDIVSGNLGMTLASGGAEHEI